MNRFKILRIKYVVVCIFLSLTLIVVNTHAEEFYKYFDPTEKYGPEHYNKETKTLKIINKDNVEGIKDNIPVGIYLRIKNYGLSIKIVETVLDDWCQSKGWVDFTNQHAKDVKLSPNGELINYKGGCPFPNPGENATKVAWNFDQGYYFGDDLTFPATKIVIQDARGKERVFDYHFMKLKYSRRTDIKPIPEFPDNVDQVWWKQYSVFDFPFDVRGLGQLIVRYKDTTKQDDLWMYIPTMRRVRRMSAGQRCDSMAGTDITWDDVRGYCGNMMENTYNFVAKKDMYLSCHIVEPTDGMPCYPKVQSAQFDLIPYEKRQAYIIEAIPKNPKYIYSKRTWYIDEYTWSMLSSEMYDRKGKLWKSFDINMGVFEPYRFVESHASIVDMIGRRGTLVFGGMPGMMNNNFNARDFSALALSRQAR